MPLPIVLLRAVPRTSDAGVVLSLTISCSAWLALRRKVEPLTSKVRSASSLAEKLTPLFESLNDVPPITLTVAALWPSALVRSASPLMPVKLPPETIRVTPAVPLGFSSRPEPSSPGLSGPTVLPVQLIVAVPERRGPVDLVDARLAEEAIRDRARPDDVVHPQVRLVAGRGVVGVVDERSSSRSRAPRRPRRRCRCPRRRGCSSVEHRGGGVLQEDAVGARVGDVAAACRWASRTCTRRRRR